LKYQYTDNKNEVNTGSLGVVPNPRIYTGNLPEEKTVTFNMTYRVLPILENGQKLLDTIEVEKNFAVRMSGAEQPFIPMELAILKANGINTFTLEEANKITKLTYPMNMTSFSDLFFFNKVNTLDLTGKGLPGTLETLTYSANNTLSTVGGGEWQEFMMPVDQPARIRQNTGRAPLSLQTLKDAIDAGQITKILYIPKTLGTAFDEFVQPYVQSGVVELLTNDHPIFPDSVYVAPQFFVNGLVQHASHNLILSYSGDFLPRSGYSDITKFNPAADVVNGQPVNLHLEQLLQSDGKNIYRSVQVQKNGSFFFVLPQQWRFDNQRYPYVKFKMFIGCDKSLVTNNGGNNHHIFRAPWLRPMNILFAFPSHSDYGNGSWDAGRLASMTDAEIQNTWHEYTVNMSGNDGGDNSNRRNRVYCINIGHEDAATWTYNANSQVVLYFADFRLCKTPND
jgi:hypothetical protein